MKKLLMPDFYVKSIYHLNFEKLKEMGIINLIVDIDNTLMDWGCKKADDNVINLMSALKKEGFNICLLSNSRGIRVKNFMAGMDIEYFNFGIKPMKIKFWGALKKLNGKCANTCVIGDQIFTDIVGGNRCSLYTVLVDPITCNEFFVTRLMRKLEKRIRQKLVYEKRLIK
jgi:HAD superfamily phosphatase (TIGR01668 family)